ncbi:MAG: hypothetical protein WB810_16490 [Candidatus Cybelea sp.]
MLFVYKCVQCPQTRGKDGNDFDANSSLLGDGWNRMQAQLPSTANALLITVHGVLMLRSFPDSSISQWPLSA